jgi:hypothetical protein
MSAAARKVSAPFASVMLRILGRSAFLEQRGRRGAGSSALLSNTPGRQ